MRGALGFTIPHVAGGGAFSPLDLPGLVAWYDASDTSSITEAGGLVSQWDDKSGNGFHIVQATGSQQPTTGSHTMNSLNTLYFQPGGTDRMASASNPLSGATACSMGYVAKRIPTGVATYAAPVNGYGGDTDSWYPYNDGNRYEWFGTSVRKSWANGATLTDAHYATIVSAAGAYGVWHNGSSVFSTGTNTVSVATNAIIGYNNIGGTVDQDISEIVLCATNLGTTDRQALEAYFAAKWI
jgi:hypothetical protein